MSKPLTIDEILLKMLADWGRSVANQNEPEAIDAAEKAKQQLSQLIAEIIGSDHDKRWNGDFCDTCDAFLEDDRFQCYCDIVNKQKGIERQRAREMGIEL